MWTEPAPFEDRSREVVRYVGLDRERRSRICTRFAGPVFDSIDQEIENDGELRAWMDVRLEVRGIVLESEETNDGAEIFDDEHL